MLVSWVGPHNDRSSRARASRGAFIQTSRSGPCPAQLVRTSPSHELSSGGFFMADLTQERLKEVLDYDPETGEFTWKLRQDVNLAWNAKWSGKVAGSNHRGYLLIQIDSGFYMAHRLAFLYMTGVFPFDVTDHINGVGTDNRWVNLREISRELNNQSLALRSDSTTGACGVDFCATRKKFRARVNYKGREIHCGYFALKEEALARAKTVREELGFTPHHGLSREERAKVTYPAFSDRL